MGILVNSVKFIGNAPNVGLVADKVTVITGLPLTVKDFRRDTGNSIYDVYARLEFAGFPDTQLEFAAFRPRAAKEDIQRVGLTGSLITKVTKGVDEAPGTQTAYVLARSGQELSLFFATTLVLEALGGRLESPIPDRIRRRYNLPLSLTELNRRLRKMHRRNLLISIVLSPIFISLWMASMAFFTLTLPWRFYSALTNREK